MRERVKVLVRKKIKTKMIDAGMQVSDENLEQFEKELTEELEETVQEKLNTFRDLLDHKELFEEVDEFGTNEEKENFTYNEGPEHHYYWGSEGEIIFVDDLMILQ